MIILQEYFFHFIKIMFTFPKRYTLIVSYIAFRHKKCHDLKHLVRYKKKFGRKIRFQPDWYFRFGEKQHFCIFLKYNNCAWSNISSNH